MQLLVTLKTHRLALTFSWLCLLGAACSVLFSTAAKADTRAWAASTQPVKAHSIVVLVDDSNTTRERDAEKKRVRFARFLVQYLQAFPETETVDVTVIGFLAMTQTVAGPMPAWQWMRSELATLECGLPDALRAGTTLFQPALQAAGQALQPCVRDREPGACHVVLFSDGVLETEREISGTIQALSSEGVSLTMVLFPANEEEKAKAREVWAGATIVVSDGAEMAAGDVYATLLGSLGLDGPLSRLQSVSITGTDVLTQPLSPWQRSVHAIVLADNPVTERWLPAPDIQAGVERWWLEPQVDRLSGTFEMDHSQGETLLYYGWEADPLPLRLEAGVYPDIVAPGQQVSVKAAFTAGGVNVPQGQGGQIVASMDGNQVKVEKANDGWWTAFLSSTVPGTHTVEVHASAPDGWDVESLTRQISFVVDTPPVLALHVATPRQAMTSAVPLSITVMVQNFESAQDPLIPTLWLEPNTALSLTSLVSGTYQASTSVISGTDAVVRAHLPGGRTIHGLPFAPQEQRHQVTVPQPYQAPQVGMLGTMLAALRRFPLLSLPFVLLVVSLVVALLMVLVLRHKLRGLQMEEKVREAEKIVKTLRSSDAGSENSACIQELSKIINQLAKYDAHRERTRGLIHELGLVVSLAYRQEAKVAKERAKPDNTTTVTHASQVRDHLLDNCFQGDWRIGLPALLGGLLNACHPCSEVPGPLHPREVLYGRIFGFGTDLHPVVCSEPRPQQAPQPPGTPRLELSYHHLRRDFVNAYRSVLKAHIDSICSQGNTYCPEPLWKILLDVLEWLLKAQDIPPEVGSRDNSKDTLQEITNILESSKLESAGFIGQAWLPVKAVLEALRSLAENVQGEKKDDRLFDDEQFAQLQRSLQDSEGVHSDVNGQGNAKKVVALFEGLKCHTCETLAGPRCAEMWEKAIDSGMAIPEQLLLEQILRLGGISQL